MVGKISTDERRKQRVRRQLRKVANGRPRLSVYRSAKHIYAQVIDDEAGRTLASASTKDKDFSGKSGGNVALLCDRIAAPRPAIAALGEFHRRKPRAA